MKLSTMGFLAFIIMFLGLIVLIVSGNLSAAAVVKNIEYFKGFIVLIITFIAIAIMIGAVFAVLRRR